jgi:hypothetical protein
LTEESTYVRPLPVLPVTAPKEKPKVKTPIPGTDWLRVTTNQGNVFYTNKSKKESVWVVPDEIKEAVELLNKKEEEDKVQAEKESQEKAQRDAVTEQEREIERIKMEVQEVVKRKAEDVPPLDESIISKKPRMRDQVEDEPEEGEGSEDDQEEDWQREAAAQLAKEAEEEKRRQQEEAEALEAAQKAKEGAPQILMPDRVDLSIEEGKALFKVCSMSQFSPDPFMHAIRRPYSGRRTSTRYIRGIRRFHYSSLIRVMYSSRPSPHVVRPLTSTVESVLAKSGRHGSRRRRRIPRKSSSDFSQQR